jgi:Ribbon-helix-helix protein, copG family
MIATKTSPANQLRFVKCIAPTGDALSVTPGQFYQVLPDLAEEHGMLRVIDNTGEDYLYEADLFEEVTDISSLLTELTIHLSVPMKAALLQMSSQRGLSMGALVRELLDERLDLPLGVA